MTIEFVKFQNHAICRKSLSNYLLNHCELKLCKKRSGSHVIIQNSSGAHASSVTSNLVVQLKSTSDNSKTVRIVVVTVLTAKGLGSKDDTMVQPR